MSFVPNLRTKRPDQEYVQSKIDVLVNYVDVLNAAETEGGLIIGIANPSSYKVAVVGTGPAGVVAAYELLRLGVVVDVYSSDQASYRYGRAFSYPFPGNEQYLAEMGAMRFPPSEAGLFFYLSKFGISYNDHFPDPGKVTTLLHLDGKSYTWEAGGSVPSLFATVNHGLHALTTEDTTLADGTVLKSPETITKYMMAGDYGYAVSAWQDWITNFEHLSFGAGLSVIFQLNPNPPGGTRWTDEDMEIFGTIGVGSGGFGPLYSVQFLEIFRLFVNELETDQKFIPTGIASVFNAIATTKVNGVSVIDGHIAHDIVDIQTAAGGQGQITLTSDAGTTQTYDRVIWAAPKWASQANTTLVEFLQTASGPPLAPGVANVVSAIKELHTISSSKAFILTPNKFWLKNQGMPANIQSDTLIRGLYCLDYTPEDPDGLGVVLISYTWQDDSAKQIALSSDKETRIKRLVEDVKQIDADFAANLVPLNGDYTNNTIFIDWMTQPNYHGAFKLNYPKQDLLLQTYYTTFMDAGGPTDPHLYLAGDDVSFMGGWCEGAIETAINAVSAVGVSLGGIPISPSVFDGKTIYYNYGVYRSE